MSNKSDKSFPISLVVVPLTPEDDYFIDVDPLNAEVNEGEVARFVIILSGNYAGDIDLNIKDAPNGAVITFDRVNPILVSDVTIMSVETTGVLPGKYEMFIHATTTKKGVLAAPHATAPHDTGDAAKATADITTKVIAVTGDGATDASASDLAVRSATVASLAEDVAVLASDVATEISELQKSSQVE